ncbi:MAG TPA: hypothetical protein VGG14_14435 [Candidatus Sulfotelmatobacter sp.]|jgi:hypothetical protein|nr:hypothetical protein [Acidobacteriaceae bacterium]
MTLSNKTRLGLILLVVAAMRPLHAGAQADQQNAPAVPAPAVSSPVITASANSDSNDVADTANNTGDRMLTPPPVSGQSYPMATVSEERSNYLLGGVTFNAAYSDNVLGSTTFAPVSDISYSVWPTIALDETTTRLHTTLTYAPGFTFYQRTSAYNQADQNLSANLSYRLSPHVTAWVRDTFQKTSNVFNSPEQGLDISVSGSPEALSNTIISPLADQLGNNGNLGITYQFSANAMVGASGTFLNLHYSNSSQVPGLYDGASREGMAFYAVRITPQHYIGVTYQYQDLLAYPAQATNETQAHAVLFFYTFHPSVRVSFSLFGGPQYYSAGSQFAPAGTLIATPSQAWTPAAGASVNYQLQRTSVAASYFHSVSGGSGLVGAVQLDSATLTLRQQLTRSLSGEIGGAYANNSILTANSLGGHSIIASAALQQQVGVHFNAQAGYTRLHQDYTFFSANPDTNREWVSVSYQFSRPLGR